MTTQSISRRNLCLGITALCGMSGTGAQAEEIIDLTWKDLLPQGQVSLPTALQGVIPHDESALASSQPPSTGIRTDWNGLIVRLSGFIVPLDYDADGVTAFLLVPFVGACIHVPPPPANQLVLVSTERRFASKGLFEAVTVTGMFGTASRSTQLAEVGYALSADEIVPFRA